MKPIQTSLFLTIFAAVLIGGCNLYDPLDKPSGNEQLLSAARAYFDQGEFDKAAEMYAEISGDLVDEAAADSAFMILNENGASMSQFMLAFGQGEGSMGVAFTKLANNMKKEGGAPGSAKRLRILGAFQKISAISDISVRGIVRFTTATAMVAELLAEGAAGSTLRQSDIAVGGAACAAVSPGAGCLADMVGANSCATTPAFEKTLNTVTAFPTSGNTGFDGNKPDWYLVNAALSEINTALNDEIGKSGKLGDSLAGFSTEVLDAFSTGLAAGNGNCAMYSLLSLGIGSN